MVTSANQCSTWCGATGADDATQPLLPVTARLVDSTNQTSYCALAEALTSGPAPDPMVEYDSMATRGSSPKAAAVSALYAAMDASSLLLGFTLTAQSP